jgi:predicted nucleotide-binding protein
MGIQADWTKALADAKKVLGNTAVVPTQKMAAVVKSSEDAAKLIPALQAARELMEKKILEIQNAGAKVKNALEQADDEISDSDYKLDSKKPDDKKKVDQAQAIFTKYFAGAQKDIDDFLKIFSDLDRHIIQLKNYKATP